MSQSNWGSSASRMTAGLLAGCIGLSLLGCKDVANSQGASSGIRSEGIAAQVNLEEKRSTRDDSEPKTLENTADGADGSAIAEASQQSATPSDNNQWSAQDFSQALLTQILQADRGCFDFESVCSYRKITFRDAELIAEPVDSGEVRNVSLIPGQPISQQQALSYAKILDDQSKVNFEDSESNGSETVSYGGACSGYDSEASNYSCYVTLNLTPNGEVAKVVLVHSSD
jgi:hypothetical protein